MSWIGVVLLEGVRTVDDRLILPGALAAGPSGFVPVDWDPPTRRLGRSQEWARRGDGLIVARGSGPVAERHEIAADLTVLAYDVVGDVTVIAAAVVTGVTILGTGTSAWPGRTFITPELASRCSVHLDRRLDCGACYPLAA